MTGTVLKNFFSRALGASACVVMNTAAQHFGNAFAALRFVILSKGVSQNIGWVTFGAYATDGVVLSNAVWNSCVAHVIAKILIWIAIRTGTIISLQGAIR